MSVKSKLTRIVDEIEGKIGLGAAVVGDAVSKRKTDAAKGELDDKIRHYELQFVNNIALNCGKPAREQKTEKINSVMKQFRKDLDSMSLSQQNTFFKGLENLLELNYNHLSDDKAQDKKVDEIMKNFTTAFGIRANKKQFPEEFYDLIELQMIPNEDNAYVLLGQSIVLGDTILNHHIGEVREHPVHGTLLLPFKKLGACDRGFNVVHYIAKNCKKNCSFYEGLQELTAKYEAKQEK